jgi:putative multiple sugar transport system permease protein
MSAETSPRGGLRDLKKIFGGGSSNVRQFGILFSLIAIILLFQFLTNGLTLSSGNLINLVSQYSYILILAIGMVMVIIAGHIDLSVGSIAAFAGIVVATAMQEWNLPWPLAILLGLVVGALIGAWQGFWVAYIGVPAFIVTLAGMLIWRGGNQVIGNANTVPVPDGFTVIGSGYLPRWDRSRATTISPCSSDSSSLRPWCWSNGALAGFRRSWAPIPRRSGSASSRSCFSTRS